MLVIGMIVEALVFILSGLDNSDIDDDKYVPENAGIVVGGTIGASTAGNIITNSNKENTSSKGFPNTNNTGNPIVIVSGGTNANNNTGADANLSGSSNRQGKAVPHTNENAYTSSTHSTGSNTPNITANDQTSSDNIQQSIPSNYAQASQNLDDFSKTMESLNEASQEILNAYRQIGDNQNLAENLTALNKNIAGLNDLFSSLSEQMTAVRYINDSLNRMRNLYDGAIGDSYMFKEESAKMTKHIEALNNVYARLLQAMTSNNNPNHNPPVY